MVNMKKTEHIYKGLYQHYKGNYYEVLECGRSSETLELMVVYKALYNSEEFGHYQIWIRPLEMFLSTVKVDDAEVPRFKFIGSE